MQCLTDQQWAAVRPFVEQKGGAGRPREADTRAIVEAIWRSWTTDCTLREAAGEVSYVSLRRYHRVWIQRGILQRVRRVLIPPEPMPRQRAG